MPLFKPTQWLPGIETLHGTHTRILHTRLPLCSMAKSEEDTWWKQAKVWNSHFIVGIDII